MHGHSAFFGAYVMINLAIITFALPHFTGRANDARESTLGYWAFWLQTVGMFGMTLAYATAGIAQTYLERIMGLGYLDTQLKLQPHFLMLTATGILFTSGVAAFLWDFFRQVPLRTAVVGQPGDPVPSPGVA
jgi:nitric oxide reductase subunit B